MDIKEIEARFGPRRTTGTLAADLLEHHRKHNDPGCLATVKCLTPVQHRVIIGLYTNLIVEIFNQYHQALADHLRCHGSDAPDYEEGWISMISQLVEHADHVDAKRGLSHD